MTPTTNDIAFGTRFWSSCREPLNLGACDDGANSQLSSPRRSDSQIEIRRGIVTKAREASAPPREVKIRGPRGRRRLASRKANETQQQSQTWLMMMSRLRLRESQSCPSLASMANGAAARASSAARNLERLMSSGHRRTEKHICTVCSCFIELPVNRHSKVNACCMKMVRNGFDQLSIRVTLAL